MFTNLNDDRRYARPDATSLAETQVYSDMLVNDKYHYKSRVSRAVRSAMRA